MLDYNARRLVAWVLREFRAQILLVSAAAVAGGYAFGCFSKARLPGGGTVSVFDINARPDRYNGRPVCVRGVILNLQNAGAEPGDPAYRIFSLKETRAAGDYDFVNILSFREDVEAPRGVVTACGVFSALKQVDKDTYHNVILLSRFKAGELPPSEGPVAGPRRSRAF